MLPKRKVNGAVKLERELIGACAGAGAIPATRPLVTGVCCARGIAGHPIDMVAPRTSDRMRIAPPGSTTLTLAGQPRSEQVDQVRIAIVNLFLDGVVS